MLQATPTAWLASVTASAYPLRRRARIDQIIKVDGDAIAVDPRGANAKAVEAGAVDFVPGDQVESAGLGVELECDLSATTGGGRIITQTPVVDLAVGMDAR